MTEALDIKGSYHRVRSTPKQRDHEQRKTRRSLKLYFERLNLLQQPV